MKQSDDKRNSIDDWRWRKYLHVKRGFMNRYLSRRLHEFNTFYNNHYFYYFNSNFNGKLLAQARYPFWLNGDPPISPKDAVALARLKYFACVTRRFLKKIIIWYDCFEQSVNCAWVIQTKFEANNCT